jgi:hypothetical protein
VDEHIDHLTNGIWIQASGVTLEGNDAILNVTDTSATFGCTAIRISSLDGGILRDVEIHQLTIMSNGGTFDPFVTGSSFKPLGVTGRDKLVMTEAVFAIDNGIQALGVTHLIIDNVHFFNIKGNGILMSQVIDVSVTRSLFQDIFDPAGIISCFGLIAVGDATNLEVSRSTFGNAFIAGYIPNNGVQCVAPAVCTNWHVHDSAFNNWTSSINVHGGSGLHIEDCDIYIQSQTFNAIQVGYGDTSVNSVLIRGVNIFGENVPTEADGILLISGEGALIEDVVINVPILNPSDDLTDCPLTIGYDSFGGFGLGYNNIRLRHVTVSGKSNFSVTIGSKAHNIVFEDCSITDGDTLVLVGNGTSAIVFDNVQFSGASANESVATGVEFIGCTGCSITNSKFQFIEDMRSVVIDGDSKATILKDNFYSQCGLVVVTNGGSGTSDTGAVIVDV